MTCPICLTMNELAILILTFSRKYRLNLTAIPKYKSGNKYVYLKIQNTTNVTTKSFTANMIELIGPNIISHIKHSEINKEVTLNIGDNLEHYHIPRTPQDHRLLTTQAKERKEQKERT